MDRKEKPKILKLVLLFGVTEQKWGLCLGKNVVILRKGDKNRRL